MPTQRMLKQVLLLLLLGILLALVVPAVLAQEEGGEGTQTEQLSAENAQAAAEGESAPPGASPLVFLMGLGAVTAVGGILLLRGGYVRLNPPDEAA